MRKNNAVNDLYYQDAYRIIENIFKRWNFQNKVVRERKTR